MQPSQEQKRKGKQKALDQEQRVLCGCTKFCVPQGLVGKKISKQKRQQHRLEAAEEATEEARVVAGIDHYHKSCTQPRPRGAWRLPKPPLLPTSSPEFELPQAGPAPRSRSPPSPPRIDLDMGGLDVFDEGGDDEGGDHENTELEFEEVEKCARLMKEVVREWQLDEEKERRKAAVETGDLNDYGIGGKGLNSSDSESGGEEEEAGGDEQEFKELLQLATLAHLGAEGFRELNAEIDLLSLDTKDIQDIKLLAFKTSTKLTREGFNTFRWMWGKELREEVDSDYKILKKLRILSGVEVQEFVSCRTGCMGLDGLANCTFCGLPSHSPSGKPYAVSLNFPLSDLLRTRHLDPDFAKSASYRHNREKSEECFEDVFDGDLYI